MTALEFFRLHAVEFNNIEDAVVSQFISSAALFTKTSSLTEEQAAFANAMYAAHLMWVRKYQDGGLRGPVTYDRDADLGRRYATIDDSTSFIGQSPYGQMYLNLVPSNAGIMTRFNYDNTDFNC